MWLLAAPVQGGFLLPNLSLGRDPEAKLVPQNVMLPCQAAGTRSKLESHTDFSLAV